MLLTKPAVSTIMGSRGAHPLKRRWGHLTVCNPQLLPGALCRPEVQKPNQALRIGLRRGHLCPK